MESFTTAVVNEDISVVCAIWRDTWTENDPLAAHAKSFIDMKNQEAKRRRATNMRARASSIVPLRHALLG